MSQDPLLRVHDLRVSFATPKGELAAVRGVSFSVRRGQVFGIVGESGCGKTATGRALLRLIPPPGRIAGGQVLYRGMDLMGLPETAMRALRGRRIAMVFQDPAAALNPVFTVGRQITGIIRQHGIASGKAAHERALALMGELGLPAPEQMAGRYPHQLSGGMQQRVMLAMALAADPEIIVADEATTALDVTIQAQIVELLLRMRRERGLTIIFITHDLGLVAEICDDVAVLYMGRIVEEGSTEGIFHETKHPYTRGLLAAMPGEGTWGRPLSVVKGSVPDAALGIRGCSFAPRCPAVMPVCQAVDPAPAQFGEAQRVWCHLHGEGNGDHG